MKNLIFLLVLTFIVGMYSPELLAGPYAPKVKITSSTSPMGQMIIKAAKVPNRAAVGIPPYPGSVILQTRQKGDVKSDSAGEYLPYIKLLSADPIDKVVAWYKAQLPTYYYKKHGFFGLNAYIFWKVKGHYNMLDMDTRGTIENVGITDGKLHADDYPDVVSMIEITYQPQ